MCWLNNEKTKKWFKVTPPHLKEIKNHQTTFAHEKHLPSSVSLPSRTHPTPEGITMVKIKNKNRDRSS